MKKKLISAVICLLVLVAPVQVFADVDSNTQNVGIYAESLEITPDIIVNREKTVTYVYTDYNSIQESIYYSEYSSGVWWNGTLFWRTINRDGNLYYVTYSGYLQANI